MVEKNSGLEIDKHKYQLTDRKLCDLKPGFDFPKP